MALTTTPSELTATALTITTAAQPNITSVGTLTGLTVSGNIAGTLTTAAQTNITSVGSLTGLTISASGDTPLIITTTNSNGPHMRFQVNGSNKHFIGSGTGIGGMGDADDLALRAYDNIFFGTGDSSTKRLIIASDGHIGVGAAPNTNWRDDLTDDVLMLGTEATLHSDAGVTTELWNNAYVDNSDVFKNISTRGASRYFQYSGAHKWFTAASASAGSTITSEIQTTPKMVLDVNGRLGIGTAAPDNPLEVVGSDSGIKISSASSDRPHLRLESGTAEKLRLSANTAYGAIGDSSDNDRYMTFKDGNVGMGTSAPIAKLSIHDTAGGAAGVDYPVLLTSDRYQADYAVGIGFRPETQSSSYGTKTAIVGTGGGYGYNKADLHFLLSSSTTAGDAATLSDARMTIKASGNVGIGDSTPDYKLDVEGSGNFNDTLSFANAGKGIISWGSMAGGTGFGIQAGSGVGLSLGSNGSWDKLVIDTSGRTLAGHTTSQGFVWSSVHPKLQIEGTDASSAAMSITRNSANGSPPYLILAKSRGGSVNSNTIVVDDDVTGEIMFAAADGTNKETRTATIYSAVDGTPGSDDMPGRLVFGTTKDGNAAPTTALTIDSSQQSIFTGNVTATTTGAGIILGNSLNAHVGTDRGSQVSLFANASGHTFHAGYTIAWNTGGNSARVGRMFLDHTGKLGLGVSADADYQFKVYSGDYYTQKLRAPNYPVLAFEAININSGNNGRISVGANNKFVLQTANAAGNTAIVMHDGKLGAGGGSDMTPDVALDVQGPVKIRANSAGGVSQSYTNMTATNSGRIIIPFAAIGTMVADDTIVFEYAATAWKSWFFKIRWSSTGGYMGELWAGGYNNNSDGFTIKNPYAGSADSSGVTADGMTLTVSRSGQENTFTLTCTTSHVHPMFEIEYACGGGEGYPLASRCSLSVNS